MGNKDEALRNSLARFGASLLTWPIEKSKLIFQGQRHSLPLPQGQQQQRYIAAVAKSFRSIPLNQHLMGMLSSGLQRGGSAFIMFYAQSHVYRVTTGTMPSPTLDHAMAGALSGALSAPFHTYWELIKVRGSLPTTWSSYTMCLRPMVLRHGIFDATFFGVTTHLLLLERDNGYSVSSSGIRFAVAAATASFTNLWFDVWKTRQMQHAPKTRIRLFRGVILPMHWGSTNFWSNYLVKGTDLTVNWFVVGCFKDILFPAFPTNATPK
jgi:hypothetical protein